jgi:alpha,alpha-trehalase
MNTRRKKNSIINSFKASGLIQSGGAMTSDLETKQQWDAPNVWPPMMSMLIEALERMKESKLAASFAIQWLECNLLGWKQDNHMHEKYHGLKPGCSGLGGEYVPQFGFGWSNGVALDLLSKYGHEFEIGVEKN